MTKKNYIRAAEIVKTHDGSRVVKVAIAQAFVSFFREDNPRFDNERFLTACFPVDSQKVAKKILGK